MAKQPSVTMLEVKIEGAGQPGNIVKPGTTYRVEAAVRNETYEDRVPAGETFTVAFRASKGTWALSPATIYSLAFDARETKGISWMLELPQVMLDPSPIAVLTVEVGLPGGRLLVGRVLPLKIGVGQAMAEMGALVETFPPDATHWWLIWVQGGRWRGDPRGWQPLDKPIFIEGTDQEPIRMVGYTWPGYQRKALQPWALDNGPHLVNWETGEVM